jgi:hypothetical protein
MQQKPIEFWNRVIVPVRDMHEDRIAFNVIIYGMTRAEALAGGMVAPVAKALRRNGFDPGRYCAWGHEVLK